MSYIRSHQILHTEDAVVDVRSVRVHVTVGDYTVTSGGCEWVRDHAVTGLEADARLEGILTNRTDHL